MKIPSITRGRYQIYVSDEGGDSDLLNLGAFNSEDVQAQRLDFDDDGIQSSLLLSFGGDPYGLVVLVNHFGLDSPGTDPDGRSERIKFKNGTVDLESASLAEAPTGRRAAIERRLPDDPSGESLLP
jgi:hypothetical protein